jgi:hypothetical protein
MPTHARAFISQGALNVRLLQSGPCSSFSAGDLTPGLLAHSNVNLLSSEQLNLARRNGQGGTEGLYTCPCGRHHACAVAV